MKKFSLLLFIALSSQYVLAQKYVPKIDAGTQMVYTVAQNGDKVLFALNVNSISDSVRMTWEVLKYGSGTYVMAAKSLQSGKKMILAVPQPDEVTKLPDSETMAFISRLAFADITRNKTMQFDDQQYVLDKGTYAPIKINDKELDVLHAISADGKKEMWILNNPDFPLICKSQDGETGVSMTLRSIKYYNTALVTFPIAFYR